jgi:hypothetical protein
MNYFDLKESIAPRFYRWRLQSLWYQRFDGVEVIIPEGIQRYSKKIYFASLVVLKFFWLIVSSSEESSGFWQEANVSLQQRDMIPERAELLKTIIQLNSTAEVIEFLTQFNPLCQSFFSIDTYALVKFLAYIQKGRSSQKGTVRYEFGPIESYENLLTMFYLFFENNDADKGERSGMSVYN